MNIKIINKGLTISLFGISGKVINYQYGETGFKLMDEMWRIVKSENLKHKGINYWVYDNDQMMFTGVELYAAPPKDVNLEFRNITLTKYVYYKHIGPYWKLKEANEAVKEEIKKRGLNCHHPSLEIYVHMVEDESKLETEILYSID